VCGRYTLYGHEDDLASLFSVSTFPLGSRYNIAPTQDVPVIRERQDSGRELVVMRWGLVPHWADPNTFKSNLFNARSESAAEKPSFRDAMRSRRCILPASGFYEWQTREAGPKQPIHFVRVDGEPLAFAGLWSTNSKGAAATVSCTMLTASANQDMAEVHDRMPVILEREAWDRWLDPYELEPQHLEDLLAPSAAQTLRSYTVTREVGNARVDKPELVRPLQMELD